MKYIFYDTNALLDEVKTLFNDSDAMIYISSVTISELEGIKSSGTKDEDTKYAARQVLRLLEENDERYEIVLWNPVWGSDMDGWCLPDNNDSKIVISAWKTFNGFAKEKTLFKTKDLNCRQIARMVGLNVEYSKDSLDNYTGYKEMILEGDPLADFYTNVYGENKNTYDLLENQYLVIKDNQNQIVDFYKWKNNKYVEVPYRTFESMQFGQTKPMDKDLYQQLAFDAIANNKITVLRGPAGSGKSYIALSYMFQLLEKGQIGKITIFCNTVATRGAAKLGFYPGTRIEKLLDSQIGNFLQGKLGGRLEVERLIEEEKLELIPLADIRGYDTSGTNAAIYITEAQNTTIDLMKLALQRIGPDSICILDGDDKTQVDLSLYGGANNGLRRVSEVFRGEDYYGEVTLKTIKRSKIAARAEMM